MRRIVLMVVLAFAVIGCDAGEPALTLSDVKISSPIAGSAQIALRVANSGTGSDELVDVSSPHAAFVEVHETVITDGRAVMMKRDGVTFASGRTVVFRPGSLHLMMLVPDTTVVTGATIPVTFTFKTHPPITVDATVVELLDLVTFGDTLEANS